MKNKLSKYLLVLCILFGACLMTINKSYAEEIRIPIGTQATDEASIDMPQKGISKQRVTELFGEPIRMTEPVGKPPITRWYYTEFVVYFADNYVIHSVRVFHPKQDSEHIKEE
jgi:outer membrane protein assembly factor BamE (lipoprotein component of BamABCDE complex)